MAKLQPKRMLKINPYKKKIIVGVNKSEIKFMNSVKEVFSFKKHANMNISQLL